MAICSLPPRFTTRSIGADVRVIETSLSTGWRKDDPTLRIKKFAAGEFHTWTDEEIGAFEAVWAVGTRERCAFALLLYTGQRASDVAKMCS
jgi:integrase